MRANSVIVDLDRSHINDRPSLLIVVLLALAVGGISGYAIGLDAAGSTGQTSVNSGAVGDRTDVAIDRMNRHIVTCDSSSGFASHVDYCLGIGEWQD